MATVVRRASFCARAVVARRINAKTTVNGLKDSFMANSSVMTINGACPILIDAKHAIIVAEPPWNWQAVLTPRPLGERRGLDILAPRSGQMNLARSFKAG